MFEQSLALYQQGRLAEAEGLLLQILRSDQDHFDSLHLLGLIARRTRRSELAVDLLCRAIRVNPAMGAAHRHLANALMDLGRPLDAIKHCDQALRLRPDFVDVHVARASTLLGLQRLEEALASFDQALALQPDNVTAHIGRTAALIELLRPSEALQSAARAIALAPDDPGAHNCHGAALQDLQQVEGALDSFDRAIALRPEFADPHTNRGAVLGSLNRAEEATESFDRAIALQPEDPRPRLNAAHLQLRLGNYEEGWRLYEWRRRIGHAVTDVEQDERLYRGQEIAGKIVFLHSEQGLGDTIQFCRYAAMLQARGARVVLSVQDCLRSLLRSLGPAMTLLDQSQAPSRFDFHCPLLSLPLALGTTLENLPAQNRYLAADPDRVRRWRDRLGAGGFKIGICWQGGVSRIDIGRSFPLGMFKHISTLANVRLINLQKGAGLEQLDGATAFRVEHFGADFDAGPDAFLDTAAVIENLDLVITCDTAVAHLAGALGCMTWLVLQASPDWRWLLQRDDSPWYPTMRLYRQTCRGDWDDVFARIRSDLPTRNRTL